MLPLKLIHTVVIWTTWIALGAVFGGLCALLTLCPKSFRYDSRLYFLVTKIWCWLSIAVAGIRVYKKGFEHLPVYPNDPSIMIMNHTSAMDVFVLEVFAGSYPHVWILKKSLARIPMTNILIHRMNHAVVQRDSPRHAMRALNHLVAHARGHARHVLMFPEGTRHSDENIPTFLSGFAIIAKKLSRPVIPICVMGLGKINPKGQFVIDSFNRRIDVVMGAPMHCGDGESVEEFKGRVLQWYHDTQMKHHQARGIESMV